MWVEKARSQQIHLLSQITDITNVTISNPWTSENADSYIIYIDIFNGNYVTENGDIYFHIVFLLVWLHLFNEANHRDIENSDDILASEELQL